MMENELSVAELQKSFEELGVDCENDVLDKCLELCKKYEVFEVENFVDAWMAYSFSKLKGNPPTIQNLSKFERDALFKEKKMKTLQQSLPNSLTIYDSHNMSSDLDGTTNSRSQEISQDKCRLQLRTPESSKKRKTTLSPHAAFSPASFSPQIYSQSSKYDSRHNAGEVVFQYENKMLVACGEKTGKSTSIHLLSQVEVQRFMNFGMTDFLEYTDERIGRLGRAMVMKYNLEELMPVGHKYMFPFLSAGRIFCDSDGRLNSKSVILEGSRDASGGTSIRLNLDQIKGKYSLFPGQIAVVEGINVSGESMSANKIYTDASSTESPSKKLTFGSLDMVIASGPFTPSDSMKYQPLVDLMEVICSEEPDVLVLTGPFLDSNHPVVLENSLAETHQALFEKIVDSVMKFFEGKKTRVLMVSSYKDCNALFVYPTPKMQILQKNHPNLYFLSDPCVFGIEDLTIGVTSTDILMHIGKEEISSPGYSTDRLSRLAGHLIQQKSFYPLAPSFHVPIDPKFMHFARLDPKPHILILPSDLRYFIKDVSDCIVVNPERLAKGVIGGTYARLSFSPVGVTGIIKRI